MTDTRGRGRQGRPEVGAAWEKIGANGPFLALELEAGALVADALTAIVRGEERVRYLAFVNEKNPGGRDGQPDRRIVRTLRRAPEDAA